MNNPKTILIHFAIAIVLVSGVACFRCTAQETEYTEINLEGWMVEVDSKLASADHVVGQQAIRIISNQLYDLKLRLPPERLSELQTIKIRVDDEHELRSAQYHPSRRWLSRNGHDPKLLQKVHIPRVRSFINLYKTNSQPFVILHELAHAYHHQFLDFDNEEIRAVFQQAIADGKYDRVLRIDGSRGEHYAKTDAKEFFAEMTEAYLGTNDFYPFVRGELKDFDRLTYELLQKAWK